MHIWWSDDKMFYPGEIGEYDEASGCHRIVYEDNEWEFVHLPSEAILFEEDEAKADTHKAAEETMPITSKKRNKEEEESVKVVVDPEPPIKKKSKS
jgi:hypothetical protein